MASFQTGAVALRQAEDGKATLGRVSPETSDACSNCQFFVLTTALFPEAWGLCSNSAAKADGQVVFHSHGCPEFENEQIDDSPLRETEDHVRECHLRWVRTRVDRPLWEDCRDDWLAARCGACRFFVRLEGRFEQDWGVCTNSASPADAKLRLEHDGCDEFEQAQQSWGGPIPRATLKRRAGEE